MKLRFLLLLAMLSGPALFSQIAFERTTRSEGKFAGQLDVAIAQTLWVRAAAGAAVACPFENEESATGCRDADQGAGIGACVAASFDPNSARPGQKAAQVAASVGVAAKTVRAAARRYEEQGLESALCEKPRPGKQRALDVGQSQRIIAMVCGSPPKGMARWSVRLIASEAVKRKLVPRD